MYHCRCFSVTSRHTGALWVRWSNSEKGYRRRTTSDLAVLARRIRRCAWSARSSTAGTSCSSALSSGNATSRPSLSASARWVMPIGFYPYEHIARYIFYLIVLRKDYIFLSLFLFIRPRMDYSWKKCKKVAKMIVCKRLRFFNFKWFCFFNLMASDEFIGGDFWFGSVSQHDARTCQYTVSFCNTPVAMYNPMLRQQKFHSPSQKQKFSL